MTYAQALQCRRPERCSGDPMVQPRFVVVGVVEDLVTAAGQPPPSLTETPPAFRYLKSPSRRPQRHHVSCLARTRHRAPRALQRAEGSYALTRQLGRDVDENV